MSRKTSRGAAALASAAALSMIATPAMARDWGWGGGWGGGWGHRHHDRVDAGDIFAGILIIGGIAAIASAASKAGKNSRARTEPRYPDDGAYRGVESGGYARDTRPQWNEGSGINAAVNRCMDEIDRGKTRVESVDSVARDGDGWRVQGRADAGGTFTCMIDGEGRIREVSINGHAA